MDSNGRIKCYARYDHSQWLDLSSISKDSVTQMKVTSDGFVPSILENFPNVNPDNTKNQTLQRVMDVSEGNPPDDSVAFVSCQIEKI